VLIFNAVSCNVAHRASNRKVTKPWFNLQCSSTSLDPWS